MVNGIGSIPGIIIVIIIIIIVNNHVCISMITVSAPMVIVIIMTIYANSHYCERGKIGWIEPVIIRRDIGHIGR